MTILGEAADRRRYVPLETSEHALAVLAANLRAGRSPVLLSGPSGIGKTLLLHVLAEREQSRVQRVRLAESLPPAPDELAGWLLQCLFRQGVPEGADAEGALVERLHGMGAERMLLVVDQIHRAPRESILKLAELARAGMPALGVVVAGTDGADLRERIASLAPGATVSLPDSLPDVELGTLYAAILADPGLSPRLRDRLANVERGEILRAAAGLPLLLEQELLRREERSAAPAPQLRCVDPELANRREPARLAAAPAGQIKPRLRPPRVGFLRGALRAGAQAFQRGARQLRALLVTIAMAVLQVVMTSAAGFQGSLMQLVRAGGESVRAFLAVVRAGVGRACTRLAAAAAGAGLAARAHLVSARELLSLLSTRISATSRGAGALLVTIAMAVLQVVMTSAAGFQGSLMQLVRAGGESVRAFLAIVRTGVRRACTRLAAAAAGAGLAARAHLASARELLSLLPMRISATSRGTGAGIRRTSMALARSLQSRARGSSAALRAVLQTERHAAPAAAVFATALFVLVLLRLEYPEPGRLTDAPSVVNVQVNARPWARVRIDGRDLGPTPLTRRLAAGVYELEARFPDGQTIRRNIEVSPERRFVSLP